MKISIKKNSKIYIAGGYGMVGSSVYNNFRDKGFSNLYRDRRKKLDLLNQRKTYNYIKRLNPDLIIFCAAKVGGIKANNDFKSEFLYENILMSSNIIYSAFQNNVKNLIYMGSSCIYPRDCKQPIKEEYLLTGSLESSNDAYAISKIAGIKMCNFFSEQYKLNYIGLMPTNLYGLNDNFDQQYGHVIPAILSKVLDFKNKKKKIVKLWGNGSSKREFLFVDDLAEACYSVLNKNINYPYLNVGSGEEVSIKKLIKIINNIYGGDLKYKFTGEESNGTPRKILNSSKIRSLGWKPKISLTMGLEKIMKSKNII